MSLAYRNLLQDKMRSTLSILGYIAIAARDLLHETQAKQETDRQTASS